VSVGGTHSSNGGGAINIHYPPTPAVIKRCTIVNNGSVVGAGGMHLQSGEGAHISECIVSFSTEGEGVKNYSWDGTVSSCIIFGNAGGDTVAAHPGNLYVDPLLCRMYEDNFSLCSNSPCRPANNSWGELIGVYGQGCGECSAPIESAAWSSIKSIFR
jgi:hypothetical protein